MTTRDAARYWSKIAMFFIPQCLPAFNAPVRGFPSEYCHDIRQGKTRMYVWILRVKKNLKICLFVSTEYTNVTNRQTDGQTDSHRMTVYAALA